MNYWRECINVAFEENGIVATQEQINAVVEAVEGGHDNYSMYMGHESIPHPAVEEARSLKTELEKERAKQFCKTCNGTGSVVSYGGTFASTSQCHKCRGEGKS